MVSVKESNKKIVLLFLIGLITVSAFASGHKEITLGSNSLDYTGYGLSGASLFNPNPKNHSHTKNKMETEAVTMEEEIESYTLDFMFDYDWKPLKSSALYSKKVWDNGFYTVQINMRRSLSKIIYKKESLLQKMLDSANDYGVADGLTIESLTESYTEMLATMLNDYENITETMTIEVQKDFSVVWTNMNQMNGHFTLDEILALIQKELTE
jgi:hypothetical protein